MSRRADPARIDEARHAATRSRLIGEGVTEATADAWIAAWETQAAQDGLERVGVLGGRLDLDSGAARASGPALGSAASSSLVALTHPATARS